MKKLIIIENVGQDIDARRKINEIIESVEQSKEEQCGCEAQEWGIEHTIKDHEPKTEDSWICPNTKCQVRCTGYEKECPVCGKPRWTKTEDQDLVSGHCPYYPCNPKSLSQSLAHPINTIEHPKTEDTGECKCSDCIKDLCNAETNFNCPCKASGVSTSDVKEDSHDTLTKECKHEKWKGLHKYPNEAYEHVADTLTGECSYCEGKRWIWPSVPCPKCNAFGVSTSDVKEDSHDTLSAPLNKDWEEKAVGKNIHSVYTHCWACRKWGVNLPLDRKCGNCGSMETMTYYDRKTISSIISQEIESARASERKALIEEVRKSLDGASLIDDPTLLVKIDIEEKLDELLSKIEEKE